jgi:hypothetical protein
VKISWEEFRKLLELDKDEFVLSWEEFQKILAQTGFKYVPSFALKEEKVVLTRSQFTRLLDQMKPPADPMIQPPAEYLVTGAVYRGAIQHGSARFRAEFNLEIFGGAPGGFVDIPLFPTTMALKSVLFDGNQALVIIKNNTHTLTANKKGPHRVAVEFSMKAQTEQGPWALSFPIALTAVTVFEADIPFRGIDVEIAGAQELEVTEREALTHVRALLSPTNRADMRWRKRPQEVERGPAKVYAELYNLLSIEDDALRVRTEVALSIMQNTVSSVIIRVPEGYNVLDVRGSGIEDWREVKAKDVSELEILFEYPKKGQFSISLTAEKLLPDSSVGIEKERTARGLRPLLRSGATVAAYSVLSPAAPEEGKDERDRIAKEADRAKKQFSANLALSEEQFVQQMENEARFGQRMDDLRTGKVPAAGGILPIRIHIPASGQLFRFAKTLVSGDRLTLSCSYLSGGLLWILRGFALAAVVALLYAFRGKIKKLFSSLRLRLKH